MKTVKLIIVCLLTMCLFSCTLLDISKDAGSMPNRAIVVEDLGNGWIYFELDNSLFLFYKGFNGYQSLAKVKDLENK